MRIVTRALLILWFTVFAVAQSVPLVPPAEAGLSAARLARIDRVIEQHIADKKISGAVTLIARHGGVAQFRAYGMADVEAGKPMKTDTIFRIASMTKPITSAAVMILYEEGHFLLTDPVHLYLPEFKDMKVLPPEDSGSTEPVPAKRPITIRHLLTHTAGLTYAWNKRLGARYRDAGITHGLLEDDSTLAVKMKALAGIPLLYHPGEKYEYGLSIDVLGYLVEVVSGKTLDEFFRERIFRPLGMKDTHFFPPAEKRARLASVYKREAGGPIMPFGDQPIVEDSFVYSATYPYRSKGVYFSGGGGLVSTAADYLRFCQMMLNGGELDGVRLLSPKTVEFMTADHAGAIAPESNVGFGLGFGVVRDERDMGELTSVGEYRWGGFFYTDFFIDPGEELIGIFMAQLHPSGGLRLQQLFKVLTYQAIED